MKFYFFQWHHQLKAETYSFLWQDCIYYKEEGYMRLAVFNNFLTSFSYSCRKNISGFGSSTFQTTLTSLRVFFLAETSYNIRQNLFFQFLQTLFITSMNILLEREGKISKYCVAFLGYKTINTNLLWIIIVELYTTDTTGTEYLITQSSIL